MKRFFLKVIKNYFLAAFFVTAAIPAMAQEKKSRESEEKVISVSVVAFHPNLKAAEQMAEIAEKLLAYWVSDDTSFSAMRDFVAEDRQKVVEKKVWGQRILAKKDSALVLAKAQVGTILNFQNREGRDYLAIMLRRIFPVKPFSLELFFVKNGDEVKIWDIRLHVY